MNQQEREALKAERPGPLTVLQLMAVLAVLGIVATIVLRHYFSA